MTRIKYDGSDDVTFTGRAIVIGGVSIVLAGAVLFGGRELGWWLRADNTNRAAAISRTNTGTQSALIDEINHKYDEYKADKATASDPSLDADTAARDNTQAAAVLNTVCDDYRKLTPSYKATFDPQTLAVFNQHCA